MSVRVPAGAASPGGAAQLRDALLRPQPQGAPGRARDALLRPQPQGAATRARSAQVGLAGLLLTFAIVVVCAASTPTMLPEVVRPIPSWLAGPLAPFGTSLGFPTLALLFALMFCSYSVVARNATRLSARTVLLAIAGLHLLVMLGPPLISTDMFSYQAYGRIGLAGFNPYLHGPSAIALDPIYHYIGARWVNTPTVYGPLFTLFSYAVAPLGVAGAILVYKSVAAAASLATIALVWHAAKLRGVDGRRAVALVGLNPLIVLYGVGGGHNDLLMLAPMVGGLVLLLKQRERTGAASIALAAGVKLSAGLLLPFAIAAGGRPAMRNRRREIVIGGGLAGLAVAVAGFAAFGTGSLRLLTTLVHNQTVQADWHSIPGLLSTGLGLESIGHVVGIVLALGFAVTTVWLLREVRHGRRDWIAAAGWSTLALLLCAGSVLPWYLAWLMPLAGLGGDRRLVRAAIWVTGIVLFLQVVGYVPHGILLFGP